MALVLGTNCGFVTVAPTTDPEGTTANPAGFVRNFKVTTPNKNIKVTSLGYYQSSASEGDLNLAIYEDGGADATDVVGGVQVGTLGNIEWKVILGLNINLTANTSYYLGWGATAGQYDRTNDGTTDYNSKTDATETLTDPWGTSDGGGTFIAGVYALYEEIAEGDPAVLGEAVI